jgi:hypothetical protein
MGFKIIAGKQSRLMGHIEFKSMNFPIEGFSLGENHRTVSINQVSIITGATFGADSAE